MPSYRTAVEPLLRERIATLRENAIATPYPRLRRVIEAELEILSATAAELDRLRWLISSTCNPDQSLGEILDRARDMWAEARAIRSEQGVDKPV